MNGGLTSYRTALQRQLPRSTGSDIASLLLAAAVCRVWLSGFVGPECIWIYCSSQGSLTEEVHRSYATHLCRRRSARWTFAGSALPAKVLGASESDVVPAVTWIGVHAPARF